MAEDLTIVGTADDKTVQQMRNCLEGEEGSIGVLCPDNHLGYSQPVGGVAAYRDHVSVSGVGYDIGCGNKAVRTDLLADDVDVAAAMDQVVKRVSFGVGQPAAERTDDHPVLDRIRDATLPGGDEVNKKLKLKAAEQLGTVGAGNHYVDLFRAESDGHLWVGVHFGSRGFGWTLANGFLWVAAGQPWSTEHYKEDGMMAPPKLLELGTPASDAYLEMMELAGGYAYAGRDIAVDKVLDVLGAKETFSVHNHHNYAWMEDHDGERFCVVRKGATPAWDGQQGFVGATMGEDSVVLAGTSLAEERMLASTIHGAGRAMSRTEAAGKKRRRWTCCNRDCDWVQPKGTHKPEDGACPKCGHPKLNKHWVQLSPGRVDWAAELSIIDDADIQLRGAAADEAPPAYKRLADVLAACEDTVQVQETLHPVGVAMAPADTFDPFKD